MRRTPPPPPADLVKQATLDDVRALIDGVLHKVLTHPHLDASRKFYAESILKELRHAVDGLAAH